MNRLVWPAAMTWCSGGSWCSAVPPGRHPGAHEYNRDELEPQSSSSIVVEDAAAAAEIIEAEG